MSVLIGGNNQKTPVDLPNTLRLKGYFTDYANPKARIGCLVRQGILYRLKRGLYIKAEGAQNTYLLGKAANLRNLWKNFRKHAFKNSLFLLAFCHHIYFAR